MSVDLSHLEQRVLIDIILCEDRIHIVDEGTVVDSSVGFLVDGHQGVELHRVQHDGALGEEALELVLGDGAFSQVVKVEDELLEADLLHDDLGLHFFLHLLDRLGVVSDRMAGLLDGDAWVLPGHGQVLERVVNGVAELDVIDFTAVRGKVGQDHLHDVGLKLHFQFFKHSIELVNSNFRTFGSVKVL